MSFKYTPNALKKIEHIYDEAKYIVRYEKGNFASGYCVLEHKKVVVVNKFLNVEGRINALLEILPSINADVNTLSGDSQKLLDQLNIQLQYTAPKEATVENEENESVAAEANVVDEKDADSKQESGE